MLRNANIEVVQAWSVPGEPGSEATLERFFYLYVSQDPGWARCMQVNVPLRYTVLTVVGIITSSYDTVYDLRHRPLLLLAMKMAQGIIETSPMASVVQAW